MKFITKPVSTVEYVEFQEPDKLEILRHVPIVKDFIPPNFKDYHRFPGRVSYDTTCKILLEAGDVILAAKQDLVIEGLSMFGLFPICFTSDTEVECFYDYFKCA